MKPLDLLEATLAASPAAVVPAGDDLIPKRPDKVVRVAAGDDRDGEAIVLSRLTERWRSVCDGY